MTPEEQIKNYFTPEYVEWWNPYAVEFFKRLGELDKKTISEFATLMRIYKSRFIAESATIFPVDINTQNYRSWVVIETGKLIDTLEQASKDKPDPVYRDHGELRRKANSTLTEE